VSRKLSTSGGGCELDHLHERGAQAHGAGDDRSSGEAAEVDPRSQVDAVIDDRDLTSPFAIRSGGASGPTGGADVAIGAT
jgi:hypothetical protein